MRLLLPGNRLMDGNNDEAVRKRFPRVYPATTRWVAALRKRRGSRVVVSLSATMRRARQCPDVDTSDTGALERARALAQGGPGGHHVVEQNDVGGQGRRAPAGVDLECAAQILASR